MPRTPVSYERVNISKQALKLASWNVRSCRDAGAQALIAQEIRMSEFDFVLLQETRLPGKKNFLSPVGVPLGRTEPAARGDFVVYSSGTAVGGVHGVAICVAKRWVSSVMSVERVSERLMAVTLNTSPMKTTLVCIYAPTGSYPVEERDAFWAQLALFLGRVPSSNHLIAGGDLNVQLVEQEGVCGKYVWRRTELGEENISLMSHLQSLGLCAVNTFFRPKRGHATNTYSSTLGASQIDYILVRKRLLGSCQYSRVRRCGLHSSDHSLISVKMHLRLRANKPICRRVQKLPVEQLKGAAVRRAFRSELISSEGTIGDSEWSGFKARMLGAAQKVTRKPPKLNYPWITEETAKLAVEFKAARELKRPAAEISRARCAYRESEKRDLRQRWTKYVEKLEAAHARNDQKALYGHLKGLERRNRVPVTAEDLASDFAQRYASATSTVPQWVPPPCVSTAPPSKADMKAAIRRLRDGKAAGPDQVAAELLKAGGDVVVDALYPVLLQFWVSGELPDDVGEATVVPLYKKGDVDSPGSYRPIVLLNTIFKVIEQLLLDRLGPALHTDSEQCGFTRGKSTTDAIAAFRHIAQQRSELQLPTWAVALDFRNAFDTLSRDVIWSALQANGAHPYEIQLCSQLFATVRLRVASNDCLSEPYTTVCGCPQGSTLGPKLFNVGLNAIMSRVRAQADGLGIAIGGSRNLRVFYIAYADDLLLLADCSEDLQALMDLTCIEAEKGGLQPNAAKTVLLTTAPTVGGVIKMGETPLCPSSSLSYLGSMVTADGSSSSDVGNRIRRAFGALKRLQRSCFTEKRLPMELRARVYKATIQNILLYGCETWTSLAADMHRLDCFERSCLRRFLPRELMTYVNGLTGPKMIPNAALYRRTTVKPCSTLVEERRWKFVHRIFSTADELVPHACLEYVPEDGKRKRGGQKLTWSRRLVRDAKDIRDKGRTIGCTGWHSFLHWCKKKAPIVTLAEWMKLRS